MAFTKVLTCVLIVFGTHVCFVTEGQGLYSSFAHVIPTGVSDQVQFYFHFSWEQASFTAGTCITPLCMQIYKLTNKTAQFFGRMSGYQWSCFRGCSGIEVISSLSNLAFTEIASFQGVKWEAGEETNFHTFKKGDNEEITMLLEFSNTTYREPILEMMIRLGVRNDTRRPNVSPSAAVLPIYSVPLGCNIVIDLAPYDGDGDYTRCRWNDSLSSASLDQEFCKVTLHALSSAGYSTGGVYRGSVFVEDFSLGPVNLTRDGRTSVSSGPFSSSLVMFTLHIGSAAAAECGTAPAFETPSTATQGSYNSRANYSSSFSANLLNATILTVGHQGTVFNRISNMLGVTETAEWSLQYNETGVFRTCVMVYSSQGVPGETRCDILLASDEDDCARADVCMEKSGRHCTDYWQYYTCSYDEESSTNIGVIVGATLGGLLLVAALTTTAFLYVRYRARKKSQVTDSKLEVKDSKLDVNKGS